MIIRTILNRLQGYDHVKGQGVPDAAMKMTAKKKIMKRHARTWMIIVIMNAAVMPTLRLRFWLLALMPSRMNRSTDNPMSNS